jgi:hypothetical protein
MFWMFWEAMLSCSILNVTVPSTSCSNCCLFLGVIDVLFGVIHGDVIGVIDGVFIQNGFFVIKVHKIGMSATEEDYFSHVL